MSNQEKMKLVEELSKDMTIDKESRDALKWILKEVEEEEDSKEEEVEQEPYCFADSTIDTIENDICSCSVGGCQKPTEFDNEEEEEVEEYIKWSDDDFVNKDYCYFCGVKNNGDWDKSCEDAVCIDCSEKYEYDENIDSYKKKE